MCIRDRVEYVGLNHLSWITSIKYKGVDYLQKAIKEGINSCLLYTSPSPRDRTRSRMPSSA